jgi:hypothetical protein
MITKVPTRLDTGPTMLNGFLASGRAQKFSSRRATRSTSCRFGDCVHIPYFTSRGKLAPLISLPVAGTMCPVASQRPWRDRPMAPAGWRLTLELDRETVESALAEARHSLVSPRTGVVAVLVVAISSAQAGALRGFLGCLFGHLPCPVR